VPHVDRRGRGSDSSGCLSRVDRDSTFDSVRTATLPTPHSFAYNGVHVMHAEAPSPHGVVVRRQHLTREIYLG